GFGVRFTHDLSLPLSLNRCAASSARHGRADRLRLADHRHERLVLLCIVSRANMNRQANPRGDGQSGVPALAAAARLLAERKSAVPDAFIAKLFELAAPEDLRHCGAAELANIAEQSWSFLAERHSGTAKIRFEPLAGSRGIAVLEIVNDDMPF